MRQRCAEAETEKKGAASASTDENTTAPPHQSAAPPRAPQVKVTPIQYIKHNEQTDEATGTDPGTLADTKELEKTPRATNVATPQVAASSSSEVTDQINAAPAERRNSVMKAHAEILPRSASSTGGPRSDAQPLALRNSESACQSFYGKAPSPEPPPILATLDLVPLG